MTLTQILLLIAGILAALRALGIAANVNLNSIAIVLVVLALVIGS